MYVVKKPVRLGGRRRIAGEMLRDDEVVSAALVRSGYVAKIDSGLLDAAESAAESLKPSDGERRLDIPILKKDGFITAAASAEAVCRAIRLIQTGAEDAIGEVCQSETEDMLLILEACDARKTVREAARRRAAELRGRQREGDA